VRERGEFFPGVPVVFAGINDFHPDMLAGRNGVTCVAQLLDFAGTLEIAFALHPRVHKVLVLHDETSTGLAVRRELERLLPMLPQRVEVEFLQPGSFDDISESVRSLPPDSIVLITSLTTDRAGRSVTMQAGTRIAASGNAPVYSVHASRLGHGIVGGSLLDGKTHGRRAGDIALRILAGEAPSSIPVDVSGASLPMFDYAQLSRFNIPVESLPPGSIVINRPESLIRTHYVVILATVAVIMVLCAVVAALALTVLRRRAAEVALRA